MTYYPLNSVKRSSASSATAFTPARQPTGRDFVWNRPVFKAPVLSNPRIALEPLPFTAVRVTQRPARA
jgi:hypothetical protein